MRVPAPIVLLVLVLGGCFGKVGTTTSTSSTGPQGDSDSASPTGSVPVHPIAPGTGSRIELRGCTNFGAVFPVPDAAAQALLPDGFKTVPAAGPPQGATLYVITLQCTESIIQGVPQGSMLLAYEELAVVPDDAHKVSGVTDYTVPLLLAGSDELLDAFAGMQLSKGATGSRSITWTNTGTGTFQGGGSIEGNGFTASAQAIAAPPTALASGAFVVFAVKDKKVVQAIDGASAGGQALDAAVTLQVEGNPPLLSQAQPAARGFSVTGFSLSYVPRS